MISGVKGQLETVEKVEAADKAGMEALRGKQFTTALESLDQALKLAPGCVRYAVLKMTGTLFMKCLLIQ